MTRRPGHPEWCGGGHLCGLGEHRAEPIVLHRPYGSVVATRVGRHVEVRVSVRLDPGGDEYEQARRLLRQVDAAVRSAVERRALGHPPGVA